MKRRATIKARTPQDFERWRRLAEELRRKRENATPTPHGGPQLNLDHILDQLTVTQTDAANMVAPAHG